MGNAVAEPLEVDCYNACVLAPLPRRPVIIMYMSATQQQQHAWWHACRKQVMRHFNAPQLGRGGTV